jgi:hypothetical protein
MPNPWQHSRSTGIADDIDFEIKGHELQFVEIELDPGESAVAEAGAMVWKDASIGMTTVFGDGGGQQGGFMGALMGPASGCSPAKACSPRFTPTTAAARRAWPLARPPPAISCRSSWTALAAR